MITNSSINALNVASNFNWKWYLRDLPPNKPVKVFSTFSCGGGSTMGYKRAGFHVLGNVELDKKINEMYVKNHHPKYNFNMDLRDFNALEELPEELYNLDILDGSPPCSTFSTAGEREKNWGVKKRFREGQKKQTLDDLFFVFLDTVKKLQPKIVIAENVVGLIKGNAKGYVNEIIKRFHQLGYEVQIFKLNSMYMEVPQTRNRVFFIANNRKYPKLNLKFDYPVITFGEVRTETGKDISGSETKKLLQFARETDKYIYDINMRVYGKNSGYTRPIFHDNKVASCVTASGNCYRFYDRKECSDGDFINIQTFPQDYDFCGNSVQYVCGMSVPPNMMAHIATEVYKQWLNFSYKKEGD